MIRFGESETPSFPCHEPIVPRNAQKQRRWKIINTLLCRRRNDWNCFSHSYFCKSAQYSTEQSQICVRNTVPCQTRTGRPALAGQSDPLFEPASLLMKTPTLSTESSCIKKIYCKSRKNEWKGSHNKPCGSKFVLMQVPWQQLKSDSTSSWQRTLRVLTIYRTSGMSWVHFAKRWNIIWPERLDSREHQKLGHVLEVTTSYLQGKYGVENRIESVNKDNSHSWVRISDGLNKLVTNLRNKEYDDNEQETSEMKSEDFAMKTNVLAFASRPKTKARPRRPTSSCSSATTLPICERRWTDIEPGTQSDQTCPVAKRFNTLLRHGHLPREEDGAIWKMIFGTNLSTLNLGLTTCGRVQWQKAEETRKDFNIVLIHHDKKFFISELFKVIQDAIPLILHYKKNNVLIPNDFFEYTYHIGCAINLHSIMNSGLIPGRQNLSKRQTVFFTSVDPMNKEHRDPEGIDLETPRLAGRDRIWPNLIWPSLFGRIWPNRIWPIPHLAKVNWPHLAILIWPNLANFCWPNLARPHLANFLFWWGPGRVGARSWGPEGGGPTGRGPNGEGARRGGSPKGWGARRGGGPKFRAFFALSHRKLHSFFSLWGFSRGILVVFEAPGRSNVRVWSSLVVVWRRPGLVGPPGFHTTTREPKRAHLSAPVFKNTTKIQREDLPEREERKKFPVGEKKKKRNFGRSRGRAVRRRGFRGRGPKILYTPTTHTQTTTTRHQQAPTGTNRHQQAPTGTNRHQQATTSNNNGTTTEQQQQKIWPEH